MASVKVKYKIKEKGIAWSTVGPVAIQAQAKSESAVIAAIKKQRQNHKIEEIIILSIE